MPRISTRTSRLVLVGALLGATAVPAATLAATNAKAHIHAIYSGGRTTDLRVGEPLAVTYSGKKIGRICWTPAPIQHFACGKAFVAPAKVGTQRLQLKFDDGSTVNTSVHIGPAATDLPTSLKAITPASHAVRYRATCDEPGYGNYDPKTAELRDDLDAYALKKGDQVAAYYVAGPHVIQAFGYRSAKPAFYRDTCLKPVK